VIAMEFGAQQRGHRAHRARSPDVVRSDARSGARRAQTHLNYYASFGLCKPSSAAAHSIPGIQS
jgi:hypothetical protein